MFFFVFFSPSFSRVWDECSWVEVLLTRAWRTLCEQTQQHENATADEKKSWNLQRQIISGCCDTKRKREIGQKTNLRWNWTTWDSLRCHMYYIICVPFGAARQAYEPSVVLCCCCRWRLMWRPLSDEMRWDEMLAVQKKWSLSDKQAVAFFFAAPVSVYCRKKKIHSSPEKQTLEIFVCTSVLSVKRSKTFYQHQHLLFFNVLFFLPQQDIHSSVEPTTDTDSVNTKRYVSMHVSL